MKEGVQRGSEPWACGESWGSPTRGRPLLWPTRFPAGMLDQPPSVRKSRTGLTPPAEEAPGARPSESVVPASEAWAAQNHRHDG